MYERIRDASEYVPNFSMKAVDNFKSIGSFKVYQDIPDNDAVDYQALYRCYSYKRTHWISTDEKCNPGFDIDVSYQDDCSSVGDNELLEKPCVINEGLLGYARKSEDTNNSVEIFTCKSKSYSFTVQKIVDDKGYCDQSNTEPISLGWIEDYDVKNTLRIYIHRRNDKLDFIASPTKTAPSGYKVIGGFNIHKNATDVNESNSLHSCFAYKRSHWVSNGDCKLSYSTTAKSTSSACAEMTNAQLLKEPCFFEEKILGYSKKGNPDGRAREIFTCQSKDYGVTDQKVVDDISECPENTSPMTLGFVDGYSVSPTDKADPSEATDPVNSLDFMAYRTKRLELKDSGGTNQKIPIGKTEDRICFLSQISFIGPNDKDESIGCQIRKEKENETEYYHLNAWRHSNDKNAGIECEAVCLNWDSETAGENVVELKRIAKKAELGSQFNTQSHFDPVDWNGIEDAGSKDFKIPDAISGSKNICGLQDMWVNDIDTGPTSDEKVGCDVSQGLWKGKNPDFWFLELSLHVGKDNESNHCDTSHSRGKCDNAVACSSRCLEVKNQDFTTKYHIKNIDNSTKVEELFASEEEAKRSFCYIGGYELAKLEDQKYSRCAVVYQDSFKGEKDGKMNWVMMSHVNATDELNGVCKVICNTFPTEFDHKYLNSSTNQIEDINI